MTEEVPINPLEIALVETLAQTRALAQPLLDHARAQLADQNTPLPQRLDTLAQLLGTLLPVLFSEALAPTPNTDRSVVLSRTLMAGKGISDILAKKREVETTDDLNPWGPKFQQAFAWFFDLVREALQAEGLTELQLNNIFNRLATALQGWEERVEKATRGVAAKALAAQQNPFISEFQQKLRPNGEAVPLGTPVH